MLPFGLDSCAVGALMAEQLGNQLIRVRLGTKRDRGQPSAPRRQPFTSIPYRVLPGPRPFAESSSRSRGFKFALVSGLAAYLAKASNVIVSESGQGALGPSLVTVGQGYEDTAAIRYSPAAWSSSCPPCFAIRSDSSFPVSGIPRRKRSGISLAHPAQALSGLKRSER